MSELKISELKIYTCETTGVSELSWDEGICVDLGNDIDKESANTIYNCIKEHDQLVAENVRLREALISVVKLQKKHYGDGMSTHLAMITKAHEIEQLLTELEKGL